MTDEIPTFRCLPGCTDCCGPVPFSPKEWQAVALEAAQRGISARQHGDGYLWPIPDGNNKCRFVENGRCSIYDKRPMVCRLFGAVDDHRLACPHGKKPDKPLTRAEGEAMFERYLLENAKFPKAGR